jgi:UDP-N-acetylglucosamine--N-acetylmuramyl-(pentapeptide) pyrophosphoryl-undecaprenol N-acetylglucosamine transferase
MSMTILFAGGGSGGHLSPGLAIAERLMERAPDTTCRFACSDRDIDRTMLEEAGVDFMALPARGFSMTPRGLLRWRKGYRETAMSMRRILGSQGFDLVVTLGGFVAAPVSAAAVLENVPVLLLNLDRVPGKANRSIARRAQQVLCAVPLVKPRRNWEVVGMPIRRAALAPASRSECCQALGLHPDHKVLLATGASQGARTLNNALPLAALQRPETFRGWQVLHLCGEHTPVDSIEADWKKSGVPAQVRPFLHCMGQAWGAADACVSRAGASSVAEARANMVPTVFLPYPHHSDDHQRHNAQPLVDLGGASIVVDEIDPERTALRLGDTLETLLTSEKLLENMRDALGRTPLQDAADLVAERILAHGDWKRPALT